MAKEASITSASQGTYSFDRRKVAYQGVQEREIRSVGAEGAPPRILRRPRSSNAEDGLDPSVKGVIDESDGVSVRKRRRTGGNHCREEFDGGPWSELELTLNNPPVLYGLPFPTSYTAANFYSDLMTRNMDRTIQDLL